MNLNTLPQKEARWANCPKPLRNHATYCFSEQWNCYAKCEVHCRFRKVSQPTVFSAMSSSSFWAPMGQLEYLVNLKCVTIVLSEFQFLHTLWNSIIILKTHLLISLKALQRDEGRERGRERERSCYLLVHPWDNCYGQGSAMIKPGLRNLIWVTYMGGRGLIHGLSSTAFSRP